jgi:hypothetical protein
VAERLLCVTVVDTVDAKLVKVVLPVVSDFGMLELLVSDAIVHVELANKVVTLPVAVSVVHDVVLPENVALLLSVVLSLAVVAVALPEGVWLVPMAVVIVVTSLRLVVMVVSLPV